MSFPTLLIVVCREGEVRLQGGIRTSEGRLEVCRLERWQTVCNVNFDTTDASVVCRELGFSRMSKSQLSCSTCIDIKAP